MSQATSYSSSIDRRSNRERVVDAFQKLRNRRFYTRAGQGCCRSCISYNLAVQTQDRHEERGEDINKIGIAYFSNQSSRDYPNISYSAAGYYDHDADEHVSVTEFTDEEIGQKVVEALEEEGLNVWWNGDASKTIRVVSDEFNQEEYTRQVEDPDVEFPSDDPEHRKEVKARLAEQDDE